MHCRLNKYLTDHTILHNNQFGFRPKLSTSLALLQLVDQLTKCMDENMITIGVFVDLAKAFDTVDHNSLLRKLEHYGVRGIANQWFCSYLKNRQQYVSLDKTTSNLSTIVCGVPQGSILGPLLFIVFINDLNSVSKKLKTLMFADDTNLFHSGKNLIEIEEEVNAELLYVVEWLQTNLLSLNVSKTSYIIFTRKKNQVANIFVGNTKIEQQFDAKFLGVIISSDLGWSKHIDVVRSKSAKNVGIIAKVRHILPETHTRVLYLALVEPYMPYCNIVWAAPRKTGQLDHLFRIQKKILSSHHLLTFSSTFKTTVS